MKPYYIFLPLIKLILWIEYIIILPITYRIYLTEKPKTLCMIDPKIRCKIQCQQIQVRFLPFRFPLAKSVYRCLFLLCFFLYAIMGISTSPRSWELNINIKKKIAKRQRIFTHNLRARQNFNFSIIFLSE